MRLLACAVLVCCASVVDADHYCVLYSYQAPGPVTRPSTTHTWAVWLKVENKQITEKIELNWTSRGYEPVSKALADARADRVLLVRWVLKCDQSFFEQARAQKASVTRYRFIGQGHRGHNCINAVAGTGGFHVGTACGIPGGQMVVEQFVKRKLATVSGDYWVADLVEAGK